MLSLHERKIRYDEVRNRIFGGNISKRVGKCRERYKKRKFYGKILESTVIDDSNDERPYARIRLGNIEVFGLLDSGASVSVLGKGCGETISKLNLKVSQFNSSLKTADGNRQSIIGYVEVPVTYKGLTREILFYLSPTLKQNVYLGVNFWKSFEIAPQIFVSELETTSDTTILNSNTLIDTLSTFEKSELFKVIDDFPSYAKLGLGLTQLETHTIDTGDSVPFKIKHYPLSPPRQQETYAEIDRMLSLGVIEESNSPYCSPIVLVRKPGKNRLCLDSRKLNELTKKDAYPLPHINGLLSRLQDTHYISGIDLKDAFWQIPLDESSREKTAFAVPGRPLYQYKVMPFGLCNAAQRMSRLMDKVIPSRLRENVFIYLDDLLVCTPDLRSHINVLKEVAKCLRNAGLTINVEKSRFCQKEIKYLGYIVGQGTLRTNQERVEAIQNFPLPTTPRQIRRFVGMTGWYRQFISNYADVAAPLTDCLKKQERFTITPEAEASFEKLKEALTTAPVLVQPDFSKPFTIQCDASRVGVGGVLVQRDGEGEEHPIAYVSQKLNKAQRNYTVTELECLAAIVCLKRFRPYVEGLKFKIITDHSSLRWLMSQKDLSGRLGRWSLKLQSFDFDIEYRKGSANIVPDALSRVVEIEEIVVPSISSEIDLKSEQFSSAEYNDLKDKVTQYQENFPDTCVCDEYVYQRVKFRKGEYEEEDSLWRLWLPSALTIGVIENNHIIASCHGGFTKTINRIRDKYFWPKMSRDVKLFVSNCETCKCAKPANKILRPPMGQQMKTQRPFQRLYMDLLGPYPRTKMGNSMVFVAVDHFTKYLFLKPLKKATTSAIVGYIEENIFHQFGVPQYIHSDNGKQFVSSEMTEFLRAYGITHVKTALYSPQANCSERTNREFLVKLRILIGERQDKWDKHVSKIASILRSDYHEAIKCSPYFSLCGYNMVQHASAYPILEKLGLSQDGQATYLPHDVRMSITHDKIRENLALAHEKSSRTYNLRCRDVSFCEGQEVFRKNRTQSEFNKGINAKLLPPYIKCRVRKKVGSSLYQLETLNGKYIGLFHAKDIKAF